MSGPDVGAHSLLGAIFGPCRCRGSFDCNLPVDRLGGPVLWFSLGAYMFKAVGTIVDQYFALSLERMADRFQVSQELANPTFVALGASAPELLASMFATFVFGYKLGVGAIVGSAVFNLLVVTGIAMVTACKEGEVKMWSYPFIRDAAFYAVALVELLLVVGDGEVKWYEGLAMMITYALYCSYMFMDQQIVSILDQMGIARMIELLEGNAGSNGDLGVVNIGDLLEVRNEPDEKWLLGKVTELDPLKVLPDGYPDDLNGYVWNMKRKPVDEHVEAVEGKCAEEEPLAEAQPRGVVSAEEVLKADAEEMGAFLARFAVLPWGVLGTSLAKDSGEWTPAEEPDNDTVVVDAASLECIQGDGPSGAVGQSGAIYRWLGISRNMIFPNRVRSGLQKALQAKLYMQYGGSGEFDGDRKAAVIHAIGPDLREPPYAGVSISAKEAAQRALITVFTNILAEFVKADKPRLRLVPLSTGALSGPHEADLAPMIAEGLGRGFLALNRELRDKVMEAASLEFCVYAEEDAGEYDDALKLAIAECEDILLAEPPDIMKPAEEEPLKPVQLLRDPVTHFLEFVMPDADNFYTLFAVSTLLLCFCSFLLVDSAQRIGCILTISPLVVGKVFLGIGCGFGDAMHSKAAAEDGEGQGIVAYVLGPKIFDILIGLGLPWTICCAIGWKVELDHVVADLLVLLIILCAVTIGLLVFNFYMTKHMGALLLVSYVVYVALSFVVEAGERAGGPHAGP